MHRLEKVGNILAEQTKMQKTVEQLKGVTALEISEMSSLARNTVSEDLNKLLTNQEAIRVKSRPVLFPTNRLNILIVFFSQFCVFICIVIQLIIRSYF